jgi:hypothetical protein
MFGWFYKLFAANRFKSQSHLAFGLVRAFNNKYKVLNNALEQ